MGIIESLALALMTPVHVLAGLLSLGCVGFAVGCAQATLGRHALSADVLAAREVRSTLDPPQPPPLEEPRWRHHLHAAGPMGARMEMHYCLDRPRPSRAARRPAATRAARLFADIPAA